jgi:hypothetical protein
MCVFAGGGLCVYVSLSLFVVLLWDVFLCLFVCYYCNNMRECVNVCLFIMEGFSFFCFNDKLRVYMKRVQCVHR